MFSDETLLELRELLRRVPLLSSLRIGYTPSTLRLTLNLPDSGSYEVLILIQFFGLITSLLVLILGGVQGYIPWPVLAGLAALSALLLYGIFRVNRRVNASRHWPANFIVDAAARRLVLPAAVGRWAEPVAGPSCRFEDVVGISARLVWADTGYGEGAEVRLDFAGGHPALRLDLRSYAVAQQLATVLRQIILAPDAPATPPEPAVPTA